VLTARPQQLIAGGDLDERRDAAARRDRHAHERNAHGEDLVAQIVEAEPLAAALEAGDIQIVGGAPVPAAETFGTPEGHAVKFDAAGEVIGLTLVNAKWLVEQNGQITITIPERIQTAASDIAPALAG